MLLSLNIKNILLVDKVEFDSCESLNIITGETGSGKSVIIDCLLSVLGGKSRNMEVSKNSDKGSIIAAFDISKCKNVIDILEEADLLEEASNEIIIRRNFTSSGRNNVYINDSPTSLNLLKQISPYLLEMYGQHDFSDLLDSKYHINILDGYGKINTVKLREKYQEYSQSKKRLEELKVKEKKSREEEDYLRHVLNELEVLDVQEGEENELAEKRINLQNSHKVIETISKSIDEIGNNSISSKIYSTQRKLDILAAELSGEVKGNLTQIIKHLETAGIEIDEAEGQLEKCLTNVNNSEEDIEKVEERLFAIREAARKYRKSADELASYTEEVRSKISVIDSFDDLLAEAENNLESAKESFLKEAERISDSRKKAGRELARKVNLELPDLKMKNAEFLVEVEESQNFTSNGVDYVTFKARLNKGQEYSDISKTASGGELARMMLSLKVAISESDSNSKTLIFDEIDTGISGSTAEAVATRLKNLSLNNQVICITHQPQTASKADKHFLVSKSSNAQSTVINLQELNEQQSDEEIARMLSGKTVTEEARAAALKLKAG
jgi:DNA repair protein RecN (Recombination protein N)